MSELCGMRQPGQPRKRCLLTEALVSQFYEAAEFLQHNVVQGHLNQSGNYGACAAAGVR